MARFTTSIRVDAPLEEVFDAFTDLEEAAQRISGIVRLEMLTDGPVGVGTRFRETRAMFKKQATEEMEVTAFDPPHGYTVRCESCGCVYETTFRFRPEGQATAVEAEMSITPVSVMAKVMSPIGALMKGTMKKCMDKDLRDLKAACESGGVEAGRPQPV